MGREDEKNGVYSWLKGTEMKNLFFENLIFDDNDVKKKTIENVEKKKKRELFNKEDKKENVNICEFISGNEVLRKDELDNYYEPLFLEKKVKHLDEIEVRGFYIINRDEMNMGSLGNDINNSQLHTGIDIAAAFVKSNSHRYLVNSEKK